MVLARKTARGTRAAREDLEVLIGRETDMQEEEKRQDAKRVAEKVAEEKMEEEKRVAEKVAEEKMEEDKRVAERRAEEMKEEERRLAEADAAAKVKETEKTGIRKWFGLKLNSRQNLTSA